MVIKLSTDSCKVPLSRRYLLGALRHKDMHMHQASHLSWRRGAWARMQIVYILVSRNSVSHLEAHDVNGLHGRAILCLTSG